MARMIVAHSAKGGGRKPGNETLGTSSSGDIVVEIDLAKFANMGELRAAMANVMLHFAGTLAP